METQVDIQKVLKHLREIIASQAQEIAILKATIEQTKESDSSES